MTKIIGSNTGTDMSDDDTVIKYGGSCECTSSELYWPAVSYTLYELQQRKHISMWRGTA